MGIRIGLLHLFLWGGQVQLLGDVAGPLLQVQVRGGTDESGGCSGRCWAQRWAMTAPTSRELTTFCDASVMVSRWPRP